MDVGKIWKDFQAELGRHVGGTGRRPAGDVALPPSVWQDPNVVRDEQGQPVLLAATSSPQASSVTTKTQAPPKTVHTSGNVAWTGTPDPSAPCSVWSISPQTGKPAINRTGKVPDFVLKADVFCVNGIKQTAQAALEKAAKISYEAGKPVYLIYNPTESTSKDIEESLIELTRGKEMTFTKTLREQICEALDSKSPKSLVLIGHSQGSISTLNALRLYIEQDLKIPPEVVKQAKKQGNQVIINFIKSKMENVRIVLLGSPVNFDNSLHRVTWAQVDLSKYGLGKIKIKLKDLLPTTDLQVQDGLTSDQKDLVQKFWKSGGILSLRHENDFVAQVLPKADKILLKALIDVATSRRPSEAILKLGLTLGPDLAKTITSLTEYVDSGSIQHTAVYFDLLLPQVFGHPSVVVSTQLPKVQASASAQVTDASTDIPDIPLYHLPEYPRPEY
jgi:hypothetical protein